MKNKIQIKKLFLNKETVTILGDKQLNMIVGGETNDVNIKTTLKSKSSQGSGQIDGIIPGQTV